MLANNILRFLFAKASNQAGTQIATSIRKGTKFLTKQKNSINNSNSSKGPSYKKNLFAQSLSTMYKQINYSGISSYRCIQTNWYRFVGIFLQAIVLSRKFQFSYQFAWTSEEIDSRAWSVIKNELNEDRTRRKDLQLYNQSCRIWRKHRSCLKIFSRGSRKYPLWK